MRRKTSFLTICCLILFTILTRAQTPTANFTAAVTSGCAPLVVNFQDLSSGNPTSWLWDFGNGATSTLRNPSTTYFNPGTYTITLTVGNPSGSNTLTRTSYITIFGKPNIFFRASDSVGCFPLPVRFTDSSQAANGTTNSNWLWDFGDGIQATQQNPAHTYTNSGNFTVTVRVTNDKGCFSVASKPAYIQINGGVQSNFTNSTNAVCQPPFAIGFTPTSTGPGVLSYFWDFGDGNTSTAPTPTHNYTTPGNYTVTLATTSSNGCSDTIRRVNLFNFININTSFTAPNNVCADLPVSFQNTASPAPNTATWDFGDGSSSTSLNPVKVYTTPGTYTVRLTNTYSYCSEATTRTIVVLPRPRAAFTANNTIRCQPNLAVQFTDQSVNAVSWQWNFGDGGTSTAQNPLHTYTNYGSFNVQLVVTAANGCTDTLLQNAFIRIQRPVISFPNLPQEGCVPYAANMTATVNTLDAVNTVTWHYCDGTSANTGSLVTSHIYNNEGNYNVKLVITTSTGCTDSATVAPGIIVGEVPVVDFAANPSPACAFQPVQFTDLTTPNRIDGWTWDFGDGSTSTDQNPAHTYQSTGLFTVSLTVNNNGCRRTLTRPNFIQVRPPIARFGFQADCNNKLRFNFTSNSVIDNTLPVTYLWDFGDGTTSNQQNPPHIFPAFGTYNVILTVTNGGCTHTVSQAIRVFEERPDFAASSTTLCRVGNVLFTSTVSDRSNFNNYVWNLGNGQTPAGANETTAAGTYQLSGLYTVSLVATDIYGCTYTVSKPNYIRINGPTASFAPANNRGCKGLTVIFNNQSQSDGISPIVNWRWNFGDGTVQSFNTAQNPSHRYPNAGNYNVQLIVRDAGGCSDSLTINDAAITSDPQAEFNSADTLACPGSPVQFINTSTAVGLISNWSFGNGAGSQITSPLYNYPDTGRYTIRLVIVDAFNCSDTAIKTNYIRVSRPVASYDVSDSISSCAPLEVQFTNRSTYYSSLLWNLGGGVSTVENPAQYYFTPGTYNTSLVATSPGGCTDTARKTIIVYPTTGTNITYQPLGGCKPLPVDLQAFTPGPVRYTWDFGDGVIVDTTLNALRHIYNSFGDFVPKVILTDPSGCVIPVTGLDTIRIIGVNAKFGLDRRLFCDSGRVQFLDSTTFNDPFISYTWNFGDGNTSNLLRPDHYYTTPGNYTVSLSVLTQSNCTDTFTINNAVKVVESPLITIRGDSIICRNDFATHSGIFLRPDTSVVNWRWRFPNNNTAIQQNPTQQQYSTAGNFIVQAIATNSSGCADTALYDLLVHPLPVVNMPATITKQAGFPLTIPATYTPNTVSYSWLPSETLSCASCPQPVTNTKFNTRYTVAFVDSNGCRNSGTIDVVVLCKDANVFVPNTFSPNGDGSNDVLMVRGRGLERVRMLRIFNRWGEVVFEQNNFPVNNPAFGWDGKFKGKPALPDVYVYQLEVFCENSQIIRFEGNVALIQ